MSVTVAGRPGPARTTFRAGGPGGSKVSIALRNASATGPSGTATRFPPDTASRWASAPAIAAVHTGLHHPGCSTGGVPGCSSRSASQLTTRRAGPSTLTGCTACESSHTTCQSVQSSMRVATACPHPSHARFGPARPSSPKQ
ncbi:hypothetical protein [Nonomuraea sp. NPDC049695]|uniref:hypothetical protein n=1 Tax=Nonomuraea sp. NPDC049695 TaxID=3154734 RepID=UPI003418BDA6